MKKEEVLKQWMIIFISSLIFYIGYIISRFLLLLLFEDFFWENNFFAIAIGLIVGVGVFIAFTVMLLMMALSVWPKIRKFDYLYIAMIVLTLGVIDITLAQGFIFGINTSITIVIIAMVLMVVLQIIARIMIVSTNEAAFEETWNKGIASLPKVDHKKREKLTRIIMTIVVLVVFVGLSDFDEVANQVVTYMVIFALGVYSMKLYHDTYLFGRSRKVIDFIFFTLTYIGVLVVLMYFHQFFVIHAILKSLLVLLPFVPIVRMVIPHFYTIYWQEKNQEIK